MKKTIVNTCKCLGFVLATLILFNLVSECMKSNDRTTVQNIRGFYTEEKNSLDVVLIGASEVYTGYAPGLAWEKYGITGYSLSGAALSGDLYQYLLGEVLERQNPQVIAFEINGFVNGDEYLKKTGTLHNVLDSFRWSENRIKAIQNLIDEENRMEFYFPISVYHSDYANYKKMAKNDFMKGMLLLNGSQLKGMTTTSYAWSSEASFEVGTYRFTDQCREHLVLLLQYCRDQGLENVVFFRAPHQSYRWNQEALDELFEIVESYGYSTLDCDSKLDEIGISTKTDFYNREHMNVNGMEKFTDYLASYFVNTFNVVGSHSDRVIQKWNETAAKTNEIILAAKNDLESGECHKYSETSLYVHPELISNPRKTLKVTEDSVTRFTNQNGEWVILVDGKFSNEYCGIAYGSIEGKKTWYYVENGVFSKTTGLVQKADGISDEWYYVEEGILSEKTGTVTVDGQSYEVDSGKVRGKC